MRVYIGIWIHQKSTVLSQSSFPGFVVDLRASPGWSSPVQLRRGVDYRPLLGHYCTVNAALCAIVCWADGSYCTMIAGTENKLEGRPCHTVLYSPCSSTLHVCVITQGSTVQLHAAQLSLVQQCEGPLAVQWWSPQKRQST